MLCYSDQRKELYNKVEKYNSVQAESESLQLQIIDLAKLLDSQTKKSKEN